MRFFINMPKDVASTVEEFEAWLSQQGSSCLLAQLKDDQTKIMDNGTQGYQAPSALLSYPDGDLVIEPVVQESGAYNQGITIDNSKLPIENLKEVYRLENGTQYPVNIDDITVAEDGLSFAINGALDGSIYSYTYQYPEEYFVTPTISFTAPVNQEGQVDSSIEAINLQNQKIDYIIKQLEMIETELVEINNSLQ